MDYWYLTRAEHNKGSNPMLVVVDTGKKNVATVAVGHTGNQAWVAKHVADEITNWGYATRPVTLFSDNEPAIKTFKQEVGARREGETMFQECPEGDSSANGAAERAVRTMEGMLRTMKGAMTRKLGKELPVEHVVLQWLVRWIGGSWSRYAVGEDGRTGWER